MSWAGSLFVISFVSVIAFCRWFASEVKKDLRDADVQALIRKRRVK